MIARVYAVRLALASISAASPTAHVAPVRIAYSSISAAMLPMVVAKEGFFQKSR